MQEGNAIEVKNITKAFKVYLDKSNNIKDFVIHGNRRRYERRPVLRGISFEVKKGEAIGLIGHNGCGKSTTLKLLTRIMYPDSGSIEIKGRVSSLIELGAGFHPDMSGRENIYINASIFGLTKKEIDTRVEDIIAFSELEEFIDNPVRTYSSGMYMRLAFAVAINVDAEVLLIDEILAVGDIAFQAKCFNKLKEIKSQGTTIVIVSHSLGQIEQICETSYWIHEGLVKMSGAPRDVHPYYLDYMGNKGTDPLENPANDELIERETEEPQEAVEEIIEKEDDKHFGSGDAIIKSVKLIDSDGKVKTNFAAGSNVTIEMVCRAKHLIKDAVFGIGIFSVDDKQIFGTNTSIDHVTMEIDGDFIVSCQIKDLPLGQGEYKLDVAIHTADGFNYDYWRDYLRFKVYTLNQEVGMLHIEREWSKVDRSK
ncbi:MAG: ABC transporter ATP-binding protein [Lachnospiraceae bacterium]|nr:ABC transporter ATP-binding protein [Lachnospiraceae bacterium]